MTGDQRTRGLIDTNIIIHLPDLDPARLPDDMVISAVTLAELSAGPHHAAEVAERARRMRLLQHVEATFEPLPFDAAAARAYGSVSAAVLAAGRTPRRRITDLMIASIAVAHGLTLYTTNPGDFVGLADLLRLAAVPRP